MLSGSALAGWIGGPRIFVEPLSLSGMQRLNTASWHTWYQAASRYELEIRCSEASVSGPADIPAIAPSHTYTSKCRTAGISFSRRPSRCYLPTLRSTEKNRQDRCTSTSVISWSALNEPTARPDTVLELTERRPV